MKKQIICLCMVGMAAAQCFSTAADRSSAQRWTTMTGEHVVGSCRFRIASMFGGHFRALAHSSPSQGIDDLPDTGPMASPVLNGGFSLNCGEANDEQIGISLGAKLVDGQWLRYDPWGDDPDLVPFENQAHVQTVQLNGKNWIGKGITVDDTSGDEERRGRIFSFCLVHKTQALCGSTPVEWLESPEINQLSKAKAILESIEFIDTPMPTSAAANLTTLKN